MSKNGAERKMNSEVKINASTLSKLIIGITTFAGLVLTAISYSSFNNIKVTLNNVANSMRQRMTSNPSWIK